jgi:hypothetical protein
MKMSKKEVSASMDASIIEKFINKFLHNNLNFAKDFAKENEDPLMGVNKNRLWYNLKYKYPSVYKPSKWSIATMLGGILYGLDPNSDQLGVQYSSGWKMEVYSPSSETPEKVKADIVFVCKENFVCDEIDTKVLIVNNNSGFACRSLNVTKHILINTPKFKTENISGKGGEIYTNKLEITSRAQFENVGIYTPTSTTINISQNLIAQVEPTTWNSNFENNFRLADYMWRAVCKLIKKQMKVEGMDKRLVEDMKVQQKAGGVTPYGLIGAFPAGPVNSTHEDPMINRINELQNSINLGGFTASELVNEFDKTKLIQILKASGMTEEQVGTSSTRKQLAERVEEIVADGSVGAVAMIFHLREVAAAGTKANPAQSTVPQTPTAPDHNIKINQGRATDENFAFSPDGAEETNTTAGGLFA